MRLLVIGASGSGTSTLGEALAEAYGCRWVDLDDLYWLPTQPRFQQKRDHAARRELMLRELAAHANLVASGSPMRWGAAVEDAFDGIVFLTLDAATRVERLRARELARLGAVDEEFLAWAARYDDGDWSGRSRKLHEAWLAERTARILRLDGAEPTAQQVARARECYGASG
ncbi:MAG TPA: hypothetical protein VGM88_00845 [Kofleriaceae bacterium]|jgi:adenylate kinase family enzyme